jgi:hypothetical protein
MIDLEKLIELRGPNINGSSNSGRIYKGVRRMILFVSLSMWKPSILAREEWKIVLRTDCSDPELEEQLLLDAFAVCTVMIADCGKVMAVWKEDGEGVAYQRDQIPRTTLDLLEQLHWWRRRWDSKLPLVSGGEQAVPETCEGNAQPFPTTYNGPALMLLVLYNTVLIYVFRILSSLISEYSLFAGVIVYKVSTRQFRVFAIFAGWFK